MKRDDSILIRPAFALAMIPIMDMIPKHSGRAQKDTLYSRLKHWYVGTADKVEDSPLISGLMHLVSSASLGMPHVQGDKS